VDDVVVDEPEPTATAALPAQEPAVEEPTATPVAPEDTPIPATATATSTATSTPVAIAAIAEPPATPPSAAVGPIEPAGDVEIASSSSSDPSPIVLLGTLLLALAAAAGQMLRANPGMFRGIANGLDGVRREPGAGAGGEIVTESAESASPPCDPPTHWSDGYDTVSGNGQATHPTSMRGELPTAQGQAPDGATQMSSKPASHLGGHGGADGLAKSGPNGLDNLVKSTPNGFDSLGSGGSGGEVSNLSGGGAGGDVSSFGGGDAGVGQDVAANAGGQFNEVNSDALGDGPSHPTDWGHCDPLPAEPVAQAPAGGSLGGGGNAGGNLARVPVGGGSELAQSGLGGSGGADVMARGVGGSDLLAHGSGGPGHGFGQVSVFGGDPATAGTGLGGNHALDGAGELLGQGPAPAGDPSSVAAGPEAHLAESLETLAQSVTSLDPATVAGAGTTPPGEPSVAAGGLGPSWLGAGALARSGHQEPLPKTFRCPQCRRPLVYGHRFCGYCGEPLDKTMA
jgi:hypothetical protein